MNGEHCPACETHGLRANTAARIYRCPNDACRAQLFSHEPIDPTENGGNAE